LVSFDVHGPYEQQINAAQEFFAGHSSFVRTFMLKPPGAGSYHQNQIKKLAAAGSTMNRRGSRATRPSACTR
jgi:hypothetical protein